MQRFTGAPVSFCILAKFKMQKLLCIACVSNPSHLVLAPAHTDTRTSLRQHGCTSPPLPTRCFEGGGTLPQRASPFSGRNRERPRSRTGPSAARCCARARCQEVVPSVTLCPHCALPSHHKSKSNEELKRCSSAREVRWGSPMQHLAPDPLAS